MIHEKWFISDTHFFHANILKFVNDKGHRIRPFSSIEEMHEIMVERWNGLVKDSDYVYHLGDVTFQYHKGFNELMSRLKGQKRLIIGNHDKIWNPALQKWFQKANVWKGFKEENFTATHFPHRLESLRDGKFNVHGHIHQNQLEDLHYINVSVEVRNYYPVHMDTILSEIKEAERFLGTNKENKEGNKMTDQLSTIEKQEMTPEQIDALMAQMALENPEVSTQTAEDVGEETPETQIQ